MPRARKSSPVEAPVVEEESDEESGIPLRFKEPLTWKAGKQIAVQELLRRLKALDEELRPIAQEEAHRGTLVPVAQELAHANLLHHRDRGVRAWTASCLVEMLRLLAPDAPFKGSQLKDIFNLFVTGVIPALGDSADPYHHQHLHVLTSLGEFQSIVLLTDLPGSDGLLMKLLQTCFDVLDESARPDNGDALPKGIEPAMTDMLVKLLDDAASISASAVDIILAQFLRVDPNTFALRMRKTGRPGQDGPSLQLQQLPAPYNMAQTIANALGEKMARAVSQYFSTIIIDASGSAAEDRPRKPTGKRRRGSEEVEDDDLANSGPSEDDLKELHKAHRLLRELWRSVPNAMQAVVPQLEAELVAENVGLRKLATETTGDLISGIGAVGPPQPPLLDPTAYPSQSLASQSQQIPEYDLLTTPASPYAFSSVHSAAYHGFMNRKNDKAPSIRATWAASAGLILTTSAGGVGLDQEEQDRLLAGLADALVDSDEKVRLVAVQAIARCSFHTIVHKVGAAGGIGQQGSVLCNLADRIKDRKHGVRTEAMNLLGRLWGVAAGAIAESDERVSTVLGAIPSRIFEAVYINDPEINKLVQQVLFDSLLPLNFPPGKSKGATTGKADSQANASQVDRPFDADAIRSERILVLVKDLEPKAKTVFFALQGRQVKYADIIEAFLKRCEEYNGGVTGKDGKETKMFMGRIIDTFAKPAPESMGVSDNLWRFAKTHDRRAYQLIRFAVSPESDYKKVNNAIKELSKRITNTTVLSTLLYLVKQCAVLVYNRSHVPTIVEISRTDEKDLGAAAHEILKEISQNHPEVFKAHVRQMCDSLQQTTITSGTILDSGTVETLKACAGFAQRFPSEMPQDRKFLNAMVKFALHASPPKAAKYAVSVIVSNEDRKDMYIKELLSKCVKDFDSDGADSLSKLACLSQLMLLAAKETEAQHDNILTIAIQKVLMQNRAQPSDRDPAWSEEIDDECAAKIWAFKILVNRLRSYATSSSTEGMETTVTKMAEPVYILLRTVVHQDGEISKSNVTPLHHKSRLRLTAAVLLLKLSMSSKHFDHLLLARDFNYLSTVIQDPLAQVRSSYLDALKKYLGQNRLPVRYYAMIFLLAFEPNQEIKQSTITWLRARSATYTKLGETVTELVFARFLSLLAHHPDFSMEIDEMGDLVEYILFYLKSVATKDNISLIYYVSQRIKSVQDGIDNSMSDNLYCLSEIAQMTIREFADLQDWPLTAWSGQLRMPAGIFAVLPGHTAAQEIADKQYAPEELIDSIELRVKSSMKTRSRKRKSETPYNQAKKRVKREDGDGKATKMPARPVKTPKKRRADGESIAEATSERRRSARASKAKSYVGMDDSEDQNEDEEDEDEVGDDEDKENLESHPSRARAASKVNGKGASGTAKKRALEPTEAASEDEDEVGNPVLDISDDSESLSGLSDAET